MASRSWSVSDGDVIVLDSDDEPTDLPIVVGKAPSPPLPPPAAALQQPSLASCEIRDLSKAVLGSPKRELPLDTDGQFQKLTTLCEARIGRNKDGKAVLVLLHKRHKKTSLAYRRSREFYSLLEAACNKIAADDGKIFVYIKEVVAELKAYQEQKAETVPLPVMQPPTTSRKSSPAVQSGATGHGVLKFNHEEVEAAEAKSLVQAASAVPSLMEVLPVANGQLYTTVDDTARLDSAIKPGPSKEAADKVLLQHENQSEGSDYTATQVAELENLLGKYSRAIQRHEEKEMDLDDLRSPASNYIIVSKLKVRATKIFKQLCNLKRRSYVTGRPVERKFKYSGTRYPEINKKVQSFINKLGSWEERMPDYHDIHRIVCACNARYDLGFSKTRVLEVAKEVFTDVGNLLQEQRHEDFVSDFGTHLTDSFRPSDDPALYDKELKDRLDANRTEGRSRLDAVINKYAYMERDEMDNEQTKKGSACKNKKRLDCTSIKSGNCSSNTGQFGANCPVVDGNGTTASSPEISSIHVMQYVGNKLQNGTGTTAEEPGDLVPNTAGHAATSAYGAMCLPMEVDVPALKETVAGATGDPVFLPSV